MLNSYNLSREFPPSFLVERELRVFPDVFAEHKGLGGKDDWA